MSFNNCAIIILLIISIFSCRKDTYKDDLIYPQDKIGTVTTNLSGIITDVDGQPLSNATVKVHRKSVVTNDQGVFLIKQVALNNSGSKLEVTKTNYFTSYRTVYPNKPKEIGFVNIILVSKGEPYKFNTTDGGTVKFNGNAKVTFSPNTIKYDDGNAYSGEVKVYSHWYNPVAMDLGLYAPADLVGKDKKGEKVVLYSYGMMAVELYGTGGEKLQIADGETAKVTFPIPSEILANAPQNIPLWSIDESTGLWKEESVAQLTGEEYIGEVSHFSFWNCDYPASFINIEGYLKLSDGTPLANYPIYIKRDNNFGAYGYTNNVGFFKGLVPNGETLTLTIGHCSVILVEQPIGPYSSDVNLGDYVVTLTEYATTLSGTLKGCVGEPLNYAYGITNTNQYISPDVDGKISTIVAGCGALDPQVTFYDGTDLNKTDEIAIDRELPNNDLGDITICNQVENYISFSIDGGIFHVIPEPELYVINNEKIQINGRLNNFISFMTQIPSINEGINHSTKTSVSAPKNNQPNGAIYATCDNNWGDTPCDEFSVNLLSVDLVNNVITGTFEGYLIARKDSIVTTGDKKYVEGSFRSTMIEKYNEASISGKIWIDLNNNGTRDPEEETNLLKNKNILLKNLDSQINSSNYNNDGNYVFDQLKPGRYQISAALKDYELTQFQSGNPDKDNDFVSSINNFYNVITEEIELSDGQDLEHIDIGLKKPVNITCNVSFNGCKPDFRIAFNLNGGIMPYTVTLNNGMTQVLTSETWGEFFVPEEGNYTVNITDVFGNTVSTNVTVIENRNVVQGIVWLDKDGGTPNLKDSNDEILKNITVTLKKENGDAWGVLPTNKYGYKINFVPEGTYYIEVQPIVDHSLLEKGTEYNSSKINVATYKSDLFTFDSCRGYQYINIGFKKD